MQPLTATYARTELGVAAPGAAPALRRRAAGLILAAAALALSMGPRPAAAQLTPADSAAVLLRTAADFEREGRPEIAEALYQRIMERFAGTPAAQRARERLLGDSDRIDPASGLELPVFGTIYGAWLGVAIPAAFGADSPEAYGAGFLAGAPLGLLGGRALQRSQRYSEGQARAVSWGGAFGTWQGFGWAEALGLLDEQVCGSFGCYDEENGERQIGALVAGGLVGIATGVLIARKPVRSGVSSAAQGGSIWGTLYGAALTSLFSDSDNDVLVGALLGGNAGLLAGALLGRRHDLGRPRVRWINLGASAGALAGLGIDLLIQPDNDNALIAIPLATSVAGLGIAAWATRGRTAGEGDGGGAPPGTSLVRLDRGGWTVNPPIPLPTMLPAEDASGRAIWRPGLTVQLFRARF